MSRKLYRISDEGTLELSTAPIRPLKDGFVRIEPEAVAINPTDWKHAFYKVAPGSGAGCDFAGVVTEIGPNVTGVKVGDRVAGGQAGSSVHNKDDGVFGELVDLQSDSLYKFPVELKHDSASEIPAGKIRSFEQAASLGIAIGTCVLASTWYNKTPVKKNSVKGWALVYGISSSLGFITAQIYQWMGYDVISVGSRKNFGLYEKAGLKNLVDYRDEDWVAQAKKIAGDDITLAYDTISENGTPAKVYETLSSSKQGKLHLSLPLKDKLGGKNVSVDSPLWYLFWNNTWALPGFEPGSDELQATRPEAFKQIDALLADDFLVALPIKVWDGLTEIPAAAKYLKDGSVSGTKIVVRIN